MRSRLFWKILAAFWVTVILTVVGVVLIVMLQDRIRGDGKDFWAELRAERLNTARVAFQYGGREAMDKVVAAWPEDERARLRTAENGRGGLVLSLAAPPDPRFPFGPLAVQLAASLIFSGFLAAYLARPIGRLRDGFRSLAQGDLGTRLRPGMGRRRDEIADLAHDFDAMAERLQHLVASRDRLLHDVSHELRSPLARLSLAVGLARQNRNLEDQALGRIETESERLNTIVGDLLSLSRAESESGKEEVYFDVADLVEVVCEDARFEAQPLRVGVELHLGPELTDPARAPLMSGAPELLRRALDNVIRNALRFSPPGSVVRVTGALENDAVVIEVRDQGPGASADLLQNMFDPFVKGASETNGVGLGLAIARRALAAHDGTLEGSNVPEGGLLMKLKLPLNPEIQIARTAYGESSGNGKG
jgi:two-component system, OmpR family, sensor kinase